jgi:hypothetical protein
MMNSFRVLFAIVALMAASGCISSQKVTSSASPRIPGGASLSIAVPEDGSYDGEVYLGSSRAVAVGLKAALIRHFPRTEIAENRGADYTIKPTILHWEDRATEWSGRPDRISISLQLYDRRGVTLDATVVEAKSSYWTLGGDHPEKLLQGLFANYAKALAR